MERQQGRMQRRIREFLRVGGLGGIAIAVGLMRLAPQAEHAPRQPKRGSRVTQLGSRTSGKRSNGSRRGGSSRRNSRRQNASQLARVIAKHREKMQGSGARTRIPRRLGVSDGGRTYETYNLIDHEHPTQVPRTTPSRRYPPQKQCSDGTTPVPTREATEWMRWRVCLTARSGRPSWPPAELQPGLPAISSSPDRGQRPVRNPRQKKQASPPPTIRPRHT